VYGDGENVALSFDVCAKAVTIVGGTPVQPGGEGVRGGGPVSRADDVFATGSGHFSGGVASTAHPIHPAPKVASKTVPSLIGRIIAFITKPSSPVPNRRSMLPLGCKLSKARAAQLEQAMRDFPGSPSTLRKPCAIDGKVVHNSRKACA
jgi:hypothetical protein